MAQPIITGSWIDIVHPSARDGVYWNRKTLAYAEEDWFTLVRHLKRDLGIELLLLQNVAKDGLSVYPTRHCVGQWKTRNCPDPLGALVHACSAEGVQLYIGIGTPPADKSGGGFELSPAVFDWYRAISEEMLERYGDQPSFYGWYMTAEISILEGRFPEHQVAVARTLTDLWRELAPEKPSLGSPFFLGGQCFVEKTDALVNAIRDTGLTVIAYQDGVGCGTGRVVPVPPENNTPLYGDLRWAHEQAGVPLWANVETFDFENEIMFQPLIPAPFARIREQLRYAAPHVDRIISYIVPGIMTSQQVCPGLGTPETEQVYRDYRAYLQATARL